MVRVSRPAIAATICALVALLCFLPGLVAWLEPFVLNPRSRFAMLTGSVTLLSTFLAFVIGVASLIDIAVSGGRRTGYAFAAIGAAAPCLLVFGLLYVPTFGGVKHTNFRMSCGTNLSGIGKAMLVYANDCDDKLPVAGGRGAAWGPGLEDWTARSCSEAFGLDADGAGGQATVSSSLYLLVRYSGVMPKSLVCKGDRRTREFRPVQYGVRGREPADLWDFGPNPSRHVSYAYHMPYGLFHLKTWSEPGAAVLADRNPWIDGPRWTARDFARFTPDIPPFNPPFNGTNDQGRAGNSLAHLCDGQNVLFLDTHVEFARRAYCALDDDNIYTSWNGRDKARGTPPTAYRSRPKAEADSLLVNDPPVK